MWRISGEDIVIAPHIGMWVSAATVNHSGLLMQLNSSLAFFDLVDFAQLLCGDSIGRSDKTEFQKVDVAVGIAEGTEAYFGIDPPTLPETPGIVIESRPR